LNKSLNFLVSLEGKDAFGRNSVIAIVQAPRSLPRVISIPESYATGAYEFVFLSSIIHAHVDDIFPGMQVTGCYQFRVTRNSDLFVDDEEVEDLLRALEGELHQRRFGDAVRLEVADDCPAEMYSLLQHEFNLTDDDIFACNGPVNLTRLMTVPDMVDRPDLKFPSFTPSRPRRLKHNADIFSVIRRGDVLLHHPFQSFAPVVEFLRQAASDPDVLVIKQTLYRTGPDSTIADALIDAARAGKEVTVVVELKARFDEQANIDLATELQEAGAHVVYGVVGHKTHCKMILVVRREGKQLRRYVHLATGNYHPHTARLYTDYGLFTCDNAFGVDVQKTFHQLTAPGRPGKLKKLLQSPFTLHKTMLELIEAEADNARAGKPARIIAKMNALIEVRVIQALYAASCAGVKIDLIVRGICALRPGIEGVSENIHVRSIVGRFLEHTRIFYFLNDGDAQVYLSSADWMGRNFFNRVETCFPIEDKRLRDRVIKQGLNNYLSDNSRAWILQSDGSYQKTKPGTARPRDGQLKLCEEFGD
jgi:polyphosphate kinase